MLRKLKTDIFNLTEPWIIPIDLSSNELREYYFVFSENPDKLNQLIQNFDSKGVPINNAYIDVENGKPHYYPISIGQFGLAVFHTYLDTKSEEKKQLFLNIANWFYDNKIEEDVLGAYWLTETPKPEYKVVEPWKSAFTQSRAISILLRAWQLTGEDKYLEVTKKALITFTIPIENKGVTALTKYGNFYEEYPASEPTMVLDGHIFALWGLYDFIRAVPSELDSSNNKLAKNLFDEGIESLIKWLPEYDMGYWLEFNKCKMPHYPKIDPCTIGYLRLVTNQLLVLYKLTNRKELIDFRTKIMKYDRLSNIIRMYFVKYKALKKLNRV